ncbi:MAG: type II toxin-antitoxin system RelE/ParE family toxin [Magnetococcus sp. XQGC-1]
MDHNFFLNHHSLPAADRETAYKMLSGACYGMLDFRGHEDDRIFLYYDAPKDLVIRECVLAEGYTYQNFLDALISDKLHDLCLFLLECEDKSPALGQEELIVDQEWMDWNCYLPDVPYDGNMDTLCMAFWLEPKAILLSLPTANVWSASSVDVLMTRGNPQREERFSLRNISHEEHGFYWRSEFEKSNTLSLTELCPSCIFSDRFLQWFDDLESNNRHRVREKLQLSSQRAFQGGEPLFKSLEGASGLREIRFDAFAGGTIRILFRTYDKKCAILTGFIKKSDHDGYAEHIPIAEKEWLHMLN